MIASSNPMISTVSRSHVLHSQPYCEATSTIGSSSVKLVKYLGRIRVPGYSNCDNREVFDSDQFDFAIHLPCVLRALRTVRSRDDVERTPEMVRRN